MRAVLDPSVIISGLLSEAAAPGVLLRGLEEGEFEAVLSPKLLGELERALAYPRLRSRIPIAEAAAVAVWLARAATNVPDADGPPPVPSPDPGDDYLIALAWTHEAALVSGDRHLLTLASEIPVFSPRAFLELIRS